MNTKAKIAELARLQRKADAIRRELGISPPGKVKFLAPQGSSGQALVVEADGFGRATASLVDGNYPVDYVTRLERSFPSEEEAGAAAAEIAFAGARARDILSPFRDLT